MVKYNEFVKKFKMNCLWFFFQKILLVVALLATGWAQETTGAEKELEGRNYYGGYGYGPYYGLYGYGHHGHYGHHYGGYYRPYSSYSYSHFNLGYRDGEQPIEGSVKPVEAAAN